MTLPVLPLALLAVACGGGSEDVAPTTAPPKQSVLESNTTTVVSTTTATPTTAVSTTTAAPTEETSDFIRRTISHCDVAPLEVTLLVASTETPAGVALVEEGICLSKEAFLDHPSANQEMLSPIYVAVLDRHNPESAIELEAVYCDFIREHHPETHRRSRCGPEYVPEDHGCEFGRCLFVDDRGEVVGSSISSNRQSDGFHLFINTSHDLPQHASSYLYVAIHELFHVFQISSISQTDITYEELAEPLGKRLGSDPTVDTPWWMEGSATYISHYFYAQHPEAGEDWLQQQADRGFWTDYNGSGLGDIIDQYRDSGRSLFDFQYGGSDHQVAYWTGFWYVAYLMDQKGIDTIFDFYAGLEEEGFEQSFVNAFGTSHTEFLEQFEAFIESPRSEMLDIFSTTGPATAGATDFCSQGIPSECFRESFDLDCADQILGPSRVNDFIHDDERPTPQELASLATCPPGEQLGPDDEDAGSGDQDVDGEVLGAPSEGPSSGPPEFDEECATEVMGASRAISMLSGGDFELSDGEREAIEACESEKQRGGPGRSEWTPGPSDVACAERTIGEHALFEVYFGEREPTTGETERWQECLPGLRLDKLAHPLSKVACPTVAEMWEARHEYKARWDQIGCHTAELERVALPEFLAFENYGFPRETTWDQEVWPVDLEGLLDQLVADTWAQYDESNYLGSDDDVLSVQARFEHALGGNFTVLRMGWIPPFVDHYGETLEYPKDEFWHDLHLRVWSLYAIQRKQDGHPVWLANPWPPGAGPVPADGPQEFRDWIDETWVPEKIHDAEVAELLKVEALSVTAGEVEQWIAKQPWYSDATPEQLLATGQHVIDALRESIRPVFSGVLEITSVPDWDIGPAFEGLDYSGWDAVSFNLFPKCDEATSVEYTERMMANVMEIVERDDIDHWYVGELWFEPTFYPDDCGTDLTVEAPRILDAILNVVFSQPVPPMGVAFLTESEWTPELLQTVEDRIFSRAQVSNS